MLREKKWFRVLLWTFGGIFAGILVLLVSVYLILKSPAVQQKILSSLKDPLQKEGVQLEFKSLSLDLFAGVQLEGMTLKLNRPPKIEGQVNVEVLRLRYKFWPLLSRRLEIREAKLTGVSGEISLKLPPPEPEPPPDPEALTKLVDLLRNPPATVEMPAFVWERVSLRVNVDQSPMALTLDIDDMSLNTSFELLKGTSALTLDAQIPMTVNFLKGATSLRTKVTLSPHLTWRSKVEGQNLAWNLELKGFQLKLDPTEFAQSPDLQAALSELPLSLDLRLDHEGLVPEKTVGILDIALPLTAKGETNFSLKPLSFSDSKSKLAAKLGLTADIDFEVNLPRDLKKAEDASWVLDNKIQLEAVDLQQAGKRTVSVPNLELLMKGAGEKGQGNVEIDLEGKKIGLAQLSGPLNLDNKMSIKLDLPQRALDLLMKVRVNERPALDMNLNAKDSSNVLEARLSGEVNTHPEWRTLHKGLQGLDQIAWPKITFDSRAKVLHAMPLEEIKDWTKLTITNKLVAGVKQTSGKERALAKFKDLSLKLDSQLLEKKASGKMHLSVEGLEHKSIKKSVALVQELNFKADFLDLLRIDIDGKSRLDKKELLDLKLNVAETPGKISTTDEITLRIDPSLKAYFAGLEILDDIGPIELLSKDQLTIGYPEKRMREVKDWNPRRLTVNGKLSQVVTQGEHSGKYRLHKPLTIDSTIKLEKNTLGANTLMNASAIEAKDLLAVSTLSANVTLGVQDVNTQKRIHIDARGGAKSIEPLMKAADKVKDVIRDAKFALKAQMVDKDRVLVSDVSAQVDGNLLTFKGKGDMVLKTGRGGFVGSVKSILPEGKNIAGLKGKGSFELPFNITLYDKKVLAINSEPTFNALSFTYGDDIQVQGLDGKVSLNEELSIDDKQRIGFLYLNSQNPFTRVDFENVDPYIGERTSLKIQKVRFKHIEAGPLLTNFELRQNLILLNEMKANLLKGSALGRVFIDLHPERLQLGFLGRFSNLQLELLKEPARRQARTDELSGRAAANFDIRKRLATGRIDVTSIGRNQLLSMIDVLDPGYQDTQMMNARRALQVSYPSLVSISMEQGLMDLLIGLGGAVSTDIDVRSIPLTAFINANAGDQLKNVEKFLQTGGQ